MKKLLSYIVIVAILLAFLLYIGQIIFKSGYIYHTDVTEGLTVNNLYQRYIYTHSNDIGESLAEKARIPLFYTLLGIYKVSSHLGLDASYFVKIKIYLLIALSLTTFIVCSQKLLEFIRKEQDPAGYKPDTTEYLVMVFAGILGGLYYVLNYWFANRIIHFGLFYSTVTVPITFYLAYTFLFAKKVNFSKLATLLVWLGILTATPHTVLFEILIIGALYLSFLLIGKTTIKDKLVRSSFLLLFGLFYMVINAYWVLPYLVSLSAPDAVLSETIVNLLGRYASLENSIRLMGYWLADPQEYFISDFSITNHILSLLPLLITLITIFKIRKANKKLSLTLLLLLVAGIFLSSATQLTNKFYFYLIFDSPLKPFGWLFREYDKFGLITAFVYSLAITLLINALQRKKIFLTFILTSYLLVMFVNFRYFDQLVAKKYAPERIPEDFWQVNSFLEEDKEDFNTVWYPGVPEPFWASNEEVRYTFSNLVSSKPTITNRSEIIHYVENLFEEENIYNMEMGPALDILGVKYLIIRRDASAFDIQRIQEKVELQESLKKVMETPLLTVYKNREFSGLVKFLDRRIVTNTGLDFFDTTRLNSSNTYIDYTDKPALFPDEDGIETTYLMKNEYHLDRLVNNYFKKFLYPYDYTRKKDDGTPGYWKLGSLEDINHAETSFFFGNIGLDINQFDYGHGIAIARDGWQRINSKDQVGNPINITFSNHPNLRQIQNKIDYYSIEDDFKYHWNIIRSDKFSVDGMRALEISLESQIKEGLVPHFKLTTYRGDGEIESISFLYPDEKGKATSVIKIPEGVTDADFSIWTLSTKGIPYGYILQNVNILDATNVVEPITLSMNTPTYCQGKCTLLARVLKSYLGGRITIAINGTDYVVNTEIPKTLGHDETMEWVMVDTVYLNDPPTTPTDISLINTDGFNAINALVFLNETEQRELLVTIDDTLLLEMPEITDESTESSTSYPRVVTKQINPTKYVVQVENAEGQEGVLSFAKPYNINWELKGSGVESQDKVVSGYANGWKISNLQDGTYVIEHKPQKYFINGLIVSASGFLVMLGYLFFDKVTKLSTRKSSSQG